MVSDVTTTLYWSRLEFARAPQDAHALHRALWKGFADEERGFLFRADSVQQEGSRPRMVVLVQAEREADWGPLRTELVSVVQKKRELSVTLGQQLRFLLRANPTVSRKGRSEPKFEDVSGDAFRAARGRRVALFGEEERSEWLSRKLSRAGLKLQGAIQSSTRTWRWTHRGQSARHDGLDFEGVIEVTDPEACLKGLVSGFGSGKAFGFGLLSIAPLG